MGIAVMRFDFTGLGHSDGEFANTTFSSNVDDLLAAASHLTDHGMAPALLIGHSLGGAAVLKAAPQIETLRAVVTIAAPFDPGHVTHNFGDAISDILENGAAEVSLGGRPFTIGKAFVQEIRKERLGPSIARLNAALLVLHAPRDSTVGIENASEIFLAAKHPKSFVTLDDADHLISKSSDAEYAADVIATWAARYVDLRAPASPGAPEGVLRISEADPAGFLQTVQAGPFHHLYADEPKSVGGTDKGLSPYGLVSAGLGACTSMTIRMYARRKNWPLEHVEVDVSHNKTHSDDAANTGKIDVFQRVIRLSGPLDRAQRDRLMEIAWSSPLKVVHQLG